jgi:flagellar biosynthesis protein FlhF
MRNAIAMQSASSDAKERIDAIFAASSTEIALGLAKRALGDSAMVLASRTIETPYGRRVELHASNLSPRAGMDDALGLGSLAHLGSPGPAARRESALERLLAKNDVPAALARELVLSIGDPSGPRHELRAEVLRLVRSTIGFGDGARQPYRHIALVGPTGVGKTTTIAKLAARDALVERKRVGLLSLDDYRIGGAEQLARYAELIDVPFEVARDETGFRRAIARFEGFDRVYIDTAGRSQKERGPLFGQRLAELCPGIGVGLTLAAGTRTAELEHAFRAYVPPRPTFLVLTKLDEAVLGGAAFVATAHSQLPIAWTTDGQRVPEDLDAARAERIAALVMGEDL